MNDGNVRRAGERHEVGHRRADRCGLEAVGLRHDPRGHEPAVAPAHDAEPVGVRDSHGDDGVDPRHEVAIVAAAPVLLVGAPKRRPVAGRAPRVRAQHRVALGGEDRGRVRAGRPPCRRAGRRRRARRGSRGGAGSAFPERTRPAASGGPRSSGLRPPST